MARVSQPGPLTLTLFSRLQSTTPTMPGGKRNPLSMTSMLETLGDVVQNAKTKAEPHSNHLASVLGKVEHKTAAEIPPGTTFVDLSVKVSEAV